MTYMKSSKIVSGKNGDLEFYVKLWMQPQLLKLCWATVVPTTWTSWKVTLRETGWKT